MVQYCGQLLAKVTGSTSNRFHGASRNQVQRHTYCYIINLHLRIQCLSQDSKQHNQSFASSLEDYNADSSSEMTMPHQKRFKFLNPIKDSNHVSSMTQNTQPIRWSSPHFLRIGLHLTEQPIQVCGSEQSQNPFPIYKI
ncbi:hypothetical protein Tcan_15616 [Toxocara canis]|uniref:Uncharacterized protein n=1 Tax=Toxocara canis TaxID=6265 RepID=A0A0B2VBW2_TOXCA|nr:hypothetical protein Tcan_15616 [Toxocara canis]